MLTRVDPSTSEPEGRALQIQDAEDDIAVGQGSVWVPISGGGVSRFDGDSASQVEEPIDTEVNEPVARPIGVGNYPQELIVSDGSLWVAVLGDDAVVRLDPRSNKPVGKPIAVGDKPLQIAAGEGAIWVVNSGDDTISRITP